MIKKVIKSVGHRARFDVTMLTNTASLDPLTKIARSPKLDKKERFFQWCMWYRTEFDFNILFIHLRTRKMPFKALVFTLRSKVELNWTRAIRPVIDQSVQFSKIAKKLNIDLSQFFSHRKEALSLLISWKKNGGHRTRFCGRAAESAHQMHFLRFLREVWSEFQNRMYVKGGRKY